MAVVVAGSQPTADQRGATRIMFTCLPSKFISKLFAGGGTQLCELEEEHGHQTKEGTVSGIRAHLTIQQLLQRGCSAAPSTKPWERQQRREAGPQHRNDEQGQKYKGGRKGLADTTPQNHHPNQLECWVCFQHRVKGQKALEAPPLVTQSSSWEAVLSALRAGPKPSSP